jgi:hypothetical protein
MRAATKKIAQYPALRQTSTAASVRSAEFEPSHTIGLAPTACRMLLNNPKSGFVRNSQMSPATIPGTRVGK